MDGAFAQAAIGRRLEKQGIALVPVIFRVAGHAGSGIVGRISQRVRPFGVIG
jgi:hypothetical protein